MLCTSLEEPHLARLLWVTHTFKELCEYAGSPGLTSERNVYPKTYVLVSVT